MQNKTNKKGGIVLKMKHVLLIKSMSAFTKRIIVQGVISPASQARYGIRTRGTIGKAFLARRG